jgi:glycosyltransferase involved in cell wall biosynthesis
VATNVGGIPEVVDERCSVLVPPRDVAALAAGLELALDRDWDEQVIAKSFRRSWEDMAQETYDVCLSALTDRAVQTQPISTKTNA